MSRKKNFTHIDSANHRCTIAQKGKNKQKRMDLRQYGLLLIVSRHDHLSMFHKVYHRKNCARDNCEASQDIRKIGVHAFICLLAFLMVMVAYKKTRERAEFTGSPHTLLERLSAVRLATFIESPKTKTKGRYKSNYQLEEMNPDIFELADGMGVTGMKLKTNIPFSVCI